MKQKFMSASRFSLISIISSSLFIYSGCNENDPTPIVIDTKDFTATIEENPDQGDIIGTVQVTNDLSNLEFSLSQEVPQGAMSIDASSGELTVANAALFDFEQNPIISATVTVSYGKSSSNASIEITISNLKDSKPDIYLYGVDWSSAEVTNYYKNGEAYLVGSGLANTFRRFVVSDGQPHLLYNNNYWFNGTSTALPSGFDATSIAVSGQDVYILGQDVTGKYQISKNGTVTDLSNDELPAIAYCIVVSGEDVYVGGQVYLDNSIGTACYWKNGIRVDLLETESSVRAMYIDGNDVYAAGHQPIEAWHQAAFYSKNGEVANLTTDEFYYGVESMVVYEDKVYIGGTRSGQGVVWTNGQLSYEFGSSASYVVEVRVSQLGILYILGGIQTSTNNWAPILKVGGNTDTFLNGTNTSMEVFGMALQEVE